jgi:outer membrane murein-binding lipoprotein Lpp
MRWLEGKLEALPNRPAVMYLLNRLEKQHMVELMKKGSRSQSAIMRTRPALHEAAACNLVLYEQLLHPDGGQLAGRCYPKGRPEDLPQLGTAAPTQADDTTAAAMALPVEQDLEETKAPGTARVVTLKGLPVELVNPPIQEAALVRGELSNTDIVAGLVDYINELKAGAGVAVVDRLRRKVDNLTGALQAARNEANNRKRAINQLNSIKAQLEEQIKDLSSQLAAANNRLAQSKRDKRSRVRTRRDKGAGFGMGEVATFKGAPPV